MKLYNLLEDTLKKEPNYVTDSGELKKWVVLNKAKKYDKDVLKLLLSENELKEKFFIKVEESLVFNLNEFSHFLEQKNYLNDSFTKYKNKIGLAVDGKLLKEQNIVNLVWPYKDCILEGGQSREEVNKNEIFFNETLAQDEITQLLDFKVLTNSRIYDSVGEKSFNGFDRNKKGTITNNLIIKGNNLLALHSLKKEFTNKVKLVYMDPPYNTGGTIDTFTYNNNFNHSSWLTFMRNRMTIAKELLREDGFIAITIDHVELYYIGVLADEIFGQENRAGLVTIVINPKGRQNPKYFSAISEYMLIYAKNSRVGKFRNVVLDDEIAKTFDKEDKIGKYRIEGFINARSRTSRENRPNHWYPIYVSKDLQKMSFTKLPGYYEVFPVINGKEYSWKLIKSSAEEKLDSGEYFSKSSKVGDKIIINHKFREQQRINNVWTHKKYFSEFQGTLLLKELLGRNAFSYPKSLYSVADTIKLITGENDIILDCFAGSGTSGHATLLNNKLDSAKRQFILIEQLEEHVEICIERNQKVLKKYQLDDNFTYIELKKYNQTFIENIEEAKDAKTLLDIWEQMKEKSFLNYNIDVKSQDENIEDFKGLELLQQKKLLLEILDKNQIYVNLSSISDSDFKVTDEEKKITTDFYQLNKKKYE